ncbi:DUF6069 family protein [Micromonospora sp. RTGN7]|uniref:DUF6069 family protein n=1 Tax=Micromonospora sp. RTGN7 TaxID=3016526 RepID=UPI0029FF410E|nr:DUF6069 family protein [Micromonospora sp. RTGN7]
MQKTLAVNRLLGIESRFWGRAAAIACAILVNWAIRTLGWLAGADFVVIDHGGITYVTYTVLAVFTTAVSVLGWVILAVLERITRFAKTIWTTGACFLLALSGVPIVVFANANLFTKICLAIINIATAVVVVSAMRSTTLQRRVRTPSAA